MYFSLQLQRSKADGSTGGLHGLQAIAEVILELRIRELPLWDSASPGKWLGVGGRQGTGKAL